MEEKKKSWQQTGFILENKENSVISFIGKKINLCVLWFDLNQILLQIPASAFDSGGKKTKTPNPNHFDATTQKPLIIIVIIIGIILILVQKVMDSGVDGCFHQLSKTIHMVKVKHTAKWFEEQTFLQADKSLITG